MLIDVPPTLSNTIMHHKHLSHLMAKSMNELAHKSPLMFILWYYFYRIWLVHVSFISHYLHKINMERKL